MRPVLGLDFDGTLFDIHTPWLQKLRLITGYRVNFEDILDYDTSAPGVPPELRSEMMEYRSEELYGSVSPLPWAPEVTRALAERYRLVCVTKDTFSMARVKADLLRRHLPWVEHLVIAADKWAAVGMDLLIDDCPHNFRYGGGVLIAQPWNRINPPPHVTRCEWTEVLSYM